MKKMMKNMANRKNILFIIFSPLEILYSHFAGKFFNRK